MPRCWFFCKHEVRQDVLVNKIHLFRVVADPFLSLELATMARTSFYPLRVKETQSAICNFFAVVVGGLFP